METYWIALRELWRESNFQVCLAGGKGGKEPIFRPGPVKRSPEHRSDVTSTLASWANSQRR